MRSEISISKKLDAEQVRKLLAAAKEAELYALYVLAIITNMRQAEIIGLQLRDVDPNARILRVRKRASTTTQAPLKPPRARVQTLTRHRPSKSILDALLIHLRISGCSTTALAPL